ncbi:uncharacterized protein LOC105356421 isoform X2 [Oryzias latipes]|uniref:uncharacterized protein LOC105356421 isoform X2 n=1 Tax=Oryzias latipes TaxID=8090 RepID=UPI000CE1DBF6|nr:uncharacterized protein LOC105356421 isoform X2 [Oryzias latipes]
MAERSSERDQSQPELSALAVRTAQALCDLLGKRLEAPTTSQATGQSMPGLAVGSSQSTVCSSPTVRQSMKRTFPHIFSKAADGPKGKRRFSAPATSLVKTCVFNVYVLPRPTDFTPKSSAEELQLATAGLGRRMISLAENWGHSQIEAQLCEVFPKLNTLKGGWMFYKSTGGSGRRKLTSVLQGPEGYTFDTLKGASCSGKNTLFLVPLQEQLSVQPLPYDSPEFAKMPKANCMKCGILMPFQLLSLHVEECNVDDFEASPDEDSIVNEDPVLCTTAVQDLHTTEKGQSTAMEKTCEVCPICQASYPHDDLPFHASTCGEGQDIANTMSREAASMTSVEELPGPSFQGLSTPPSAAWEKEEDPKEACQLFRQQLLLRYSKCPHLLLSINMFDSEEDKDRSFIEFYKRNNVEWAAPFKCMLTGDAAIGEGVTRHVLSMAMQKLTTGFSINLGSASLTPLFEGERDHLVPSAAGVLRECKLFEMAGRIIGHNFFHGGSGLPGLSMAVVTLLTGGDIDTAVAALTIEDVADIEHRETIALLKKPELTVEEITRVLHNGMQPIKQIRKGLKDTGIWPLILARPDVHCILFPREASVELSSQTMIESICWPQSICDSDEDDEEPVPLKDISTVTGFLRKFIEEASPKVLCDLMKFWVGWEHQTRSLYVKVVRSTYPVAHTCLYTLELPSHYSTYKMFKEDMIMALSSISSGFGKV